jgi:Methylamine utilisation protein MauE
MLVFMEYAALFCRWTVGIALGLAFVTKVGDLQRFSDTITAFNLLPKAFSRWLAMLFLAAEMLVVVLLITGQFQPVFLVLGFGLAVVLLTAFSIGLAGVLNRKGKPKIRCNCFGAISADKAVSFYDIWRNLLLGSCALLGGVLALSKLVTTVPASFTPGIAEWTLMGFASLVFVMVSLHIGELAGLLKPQVN